ncbi:MAG: cytochrome c [Alphaproteobacteria bacterium]|nr:cytochrome c [Alphaproteobacteria bacterium]
MRMLAPTITLLAALAALPAVAQPASQPAGDIPAGRAIAQTWCANCHAVEITAQQTADGVPSFPAVARMASTTQLSLHAFLQTPHQRMPNFQLSRQQIDDVAAYILSLKK